MKAPEIVEESMKLREIMVTDVATVSPDEPVSVAAQKMRQDGIGCLVVTVDGMVKGMLTDRDLLACLGQAHDAGVCKVSNHMTSSVIVEGPDQELFMATEIMADKRIKRLPIVEHEKLVGLVSFSDIADLINYEWQRVWWKLVPMTRLIKAESNYRRGRRPNAPAEHARL